MDKPLLEVRNLRKCYDDFEALKGVNFSIGSGLMVGLIGPNGCGKSTMMKCICKIHEPTSGEIFIDGESTKGKKASQLAKLVANVAAESRGSFGLSVTDMVMLGRHPHVDSVWWESENDEEIAMDSIRRFGLESLKDKQLNMLSSGELQRAMIAKAYVQSPRLMMVDEPTSHLDMKYKLEVMEYLQAMVKTDMSILVAEHDISLMARYCDLCIIMKKGEIVTIGDPKKVITEELIEEVYEVDARVGTDPDGEIYILPKRFRSSKAKMFHE